LVARHRIELCPVAFQTTTLPSSSRAVSFGGRCETRTRIARVQAVGTLAVATGVEPVPPDRQSGNLHPIAHKTKKRARWGPRPAARPCDQH